jgi:signal transduction histidine kinase/ligand-binding sensor domain-containing protein/CheY-like chemotaxis protein
VRNDRSARLLAWAWPTLIASPLAAQLPVQLGTEELAFARQEWDSTNGLPQNSATTILQARDGFLWIGTYGGLCRFDGQRMEVFDTVSAPGLPGNRVLCLHETSDGTLWIGSDQSGLASASQGQFRAHPELAQDVIAALGSDSGGRLLVGTVEGLFVREEERFRLLPAPAPGGVRRIGARRDGTPLVLGFDGLYTLEGDELRWLWSGFALCMAQVEHGIVLGDQNGLRLLSSAGEVREVVPSLRSSVHSLLLTRDGALWAGTTLGPVRIDRAWLEEDAPLENVAALPDLPGARSARALCEDREGGVWVGYTESGLLRLRTAEVKAYRGENGLPARGIITVLGDGRDGLFVGTSEGLFHGRAGKFARVEGSAELGLRAMTLDPDGTLWFASRTGLARLGAEGVEPWLGSGPVHDVRAIEREADGSHWLAGGDGLALLTGRELSFLPVLEPLRSELLRSLALAPDGALWIGGAALLARLDPARTTLRIWRSGAELPLGEVRSILPERGERAWLATYGGGLVRISGAEVLAIDKRHGLQDQSLCAAVLLGENLALSSNSGPFLVSRAALADVADGRATRLASHPLRTAGSRPAEGDGGVQPCASVIGGRFFFCGIDALHEFDPTRLQPRTADLPTRLESLYPEGARWIGANEVLLPRGRRELELRLGTVSFDYPSGVRFRWCLNSDPWSEPSPERSVRLIDVPRGRHVFEAQAIDIDGRISPESLRFALTVPARTFETWPFLLGVPLALLLLTGVLVRVGTWRSSRRTAQLESLVVARTHELSQAGHELERRVEERTRELSVALERQREEEAERRRVEYELEALRRMESLGLLAGGVAHDFNNLLMVAAGASELLALKLEGPRERELCQSIRDACLRGRALTQHLLAVASRQPLAPEPLELNQVLEKLLPVLRSLLGDGIVLSFHPAAGGAPVRAAQAQIEQLLLNVVSNARDALPRGGTVALGLARKAERIMLTVRDDGEGMPPEVAQRVFEPFFSTRPGSGRGLGLATVYGIVRQLGGEVRLDSALGHGTTVRIELPRVEPGSSEASERNEVLHPRPRLAARRVLLIEDEPNVRRVVRMLLESLACHVVEAENGAQALARLKEAGAPFDLVLSDVVMPGLQGRELVAALRAAAPRLPLVLMSGYLDDRISLRDLAESGIEVLAKPLDRTRLEAVLRGACSLTAEVE